MDAIVAKEVMNMGMKTMEVMGLIKSIMRTILLLLEGNLLEKLVELILQ